MKQVCQSLAVTMLAGLFVIVSPSGAIAQDEPTDSPTSYEPSQTALTLTAPSQTRVDSRVTVEASLSSVGAPLENQPIVFRVGGVNYGPISTDTAGVAKFGITAARVGSLTIEANFAGSEEFNAATAQQKISVRKHRTSVQLTVPRSVKDQQVLIVRAKVTSNGKRLASKTAKLTVREPGRAKTRRIAARTDANGIARWRLRIYRNAQLSASTIATEKRSAAKSSTRTVEFLPNAPVVRLPGPSPTVKVAKQPMAVSFGANVRVMPIPDSVWADMRGKTWRPGCMSRGSLRLIRTNYWSFDGYRRQGELIVAASAAKKYRAALYRLYTAKVPIRSMYRVDKFGYSKKLHGGDDHKSMAADNTSAFNCRGVANNPSVRSPHSSGRSFDINPWENPYASFPPRFWKGRDHKSKAAWNSSGDPAVKALRLAGFAWTYGNVDGHHFEG